MVGTHVGRAVLGMRTRGTVAGRRGASGRDGGRVPVVRLLMVLLMVAGVLRRWAAVVARCCSHSCCRVHLRHLLLHSVRRGSRGLRTVACAAGRARDARETAATAVTDPTGSRAAPRRGRGRLGAAVARVELIYGRHERERVLIIWRQGLARRHALTPRVGAGVHLEILKSRLETLRNTKSWLAHSE